jgi:hypothetical protein
MKWMLWNDGVDMAEFGMTRVRIGLFQHALAHPEANSERFESIEAKLDELRSYLYANRESVRGYAEAYRNGERISTAHVESTVNQLINWRMCKKHQMGWSRAGAQQLLHVKTASTRSKEGGASDPLLHPPLTYFRTFAVRVFEESRYRLTSWRFKKEIRLLLTHSA